MVRNSRARDNGDVGGGCGGGISEVSSVETTRARALAMAFVKKRRVKASSKSKISNSFDKIKSSSSFSSGAIKRRRRRRVNPVTTPMIDVSGHRTHDVDDRCSFPGSDHALESCCSSSNRSGERIVFVDLDESVEVGTSTYYTCRERREETTPSPSEIRSESSTDLESTAERPPEMRYRLMEEKMPTESELEEFFAEAEKSLQQKFVSKYNYNIVKDEPLQGRYEWIPLKP